MKGQIMTSEEKITATEIKEFLGNEQRFSWVEWVEIAHKITEKHVGATSQTPADQLPNNPLGLTNILEIINY